MNAFQPPEFRPHRLYRGGHLQTLASLRLPQEGFAPDQAHKVELSDGDAIVLHENGPVDTAGNRLDQQTDRVMVLVHGLSGCHWIALHDSLGKTSRTVAMDGLPR